LERVRVYRGLVVRAAFEALRADFAAYMTLYFSTRYDTRFLKSVGDEVVAVKFYPKGLTTNSDAGCDPHDRAVPPVLAAMEELGIPLCVHPEAPGYHEDREVLFHGHVERWARRFPALKIVLEHVSDRRTLGLLDLPNVYATVTPHHLALTGDDLIGPPLRPHNYCMPVAKRPEDRAALQVFMACSPDDRFRKVMLGTDSAPHPAWAKESSRCCAGVFNAPVALPVVTRVFEQRGCLHRLQAFVSGNARAVYGIDPPPYRVLLYRSPFKVPDRYGDVVPLMAGETLPWTAEPAIQSE
jgi:dihydroorotase